MTKSNAVVTTVSHTAAGATATARPGVATGPSRAGKPGLLMLGTLDRSFGTCRRSRMGLPGRDDVARSAGYDTPGLLPAAYAAPRSDFLAHLR
jgi:hypothetical protein